MRTPVFDECVRLYAHGVLDGDVVLHRDPDGKAFAWHSPLDNGAIKCSICESGVRVYLREWEHD